MDIKIATHKKQELIDITNLVRSEVVRNNIKDGIAVVFVPHTTAGVTINENADPDVVDDILLSLNKSFPELREFRHMEGNSDAHIKASLFGASSTIIIENGDLKLGTWQGIYLCEFDGPRNRNIYIKIIGV